MIEAIFVSMYIVLMCAIVNMFLSSIRKDEL